MAFIRRYVIDKVICSIKEGTSIVSNEELLRLKSTTILDDFFRIYRCYMEKGHYNNKFTNYYVDAFNKFDKDFPEKIRHNIRTASFSALSENQLPTFMEMWGHYASSHTGFCIRYDLRKWKRKNSINTDSLTLENMVLSCLLPCEYLERPRIIADTYVYKKIMEICLSEKEKLALEKSAIRAYLRKSTSWQYENEWRIVLPSEYTKISDNSISFPCIDSVYLGCNMSVSDKELIVDITTSKEFKIYESILMDNKYELWFKEIDESKYYKEKKYQQDISLSKYLTHD